jgi:hypothetical protein
MTKLIRKFRDVGKKILLACNRRNYTYKNFAAIKLATNNCIAFLWYCLNIIFVRNSEK